MQRWSVALPHALASPAGLLRVGRCGPSIIGALVLGALALGEPCAATAQVPDWDPPSSRGFELMPRSGGSYEMGFWTAGLSDGGRLTSLSGLLRLGIVLERAVELRLSGGWAWGDLDRNELGVDGDAGAFANPMVSVFGITGEQRWRLRFGGGLALPGVPSTRQAAWAAYFASATRGLEQLWLWAPQGLTPVLEVSLETVPIDYLYLEADVAAGSIFPVGNQPVVPRETERIVDLSIDASAAIGLRHDNFLGGARWRTIFNPTFQDVDPIQSSVELFARGTGRLTNPPLEIFGEARFFANIDRPLGFAFEEGGTWGLFLAAGVSTTPAQIPEGRYGVEEVRFEGMEQLDRQELAERLGTRARPEFLFWSWPWTAWPLFDESVFERDIERVERWLRARGYYEGEVLEAVVDPPDATAAEPATEACGGPGEPECTARITFRIAEGRPTTVARMSLRGIDSLPEAMRGQLREVLLFTAGDPFDETLFEETKVRMLRVLADAGYARARVAGEVKVNRERHEAFIIFAIDAGLPAVIGRVCISGHGNDFPPDVMLAVANLEPGERFSLRLLEEAQRALYALGAFGGVEVGPHEEDEGVIAPREESGDRRDDGALEDAPAGDDPGSSEENVDLGTPEVYCQPGPEAVPPNTVPVDIDVEVSAGQLERLGFGVGIQAGQSVTFGTDTATFANLQAAAQWDLHLSFAYEHRNVAERLIRTHFEVRPRVIFQMPFLNFIPAEPLPFGVQAAGSMRVPFCLEARTNCVTQLRYDLGPEPFTGFFRSELDWLGGLDRSFFDGRLYLGAFAHFNWFLPTDRQPFDPFDQLPQTFAVWLEEAVRVDLRDDPRNPRAGAFFAASSQQSVQPLSAWDMVRWTAEARGYVPLPLGIVIAARVALGMTHIFGFNEDLLDPFNVYQLAQLGPTALHLRGGGASSNRGYLPGLLGDARQVYVTQPRSSEQLARGNPVRRRPVRISGGTSLWEASLELRVPLTSDFGVVAFADAGDVVRPDIGSDTGPVFYFGQAPASTFRPQLSFGLGVRYRTIIGPLRLDFAVAPPELQEFGREETLPPTCRNDAASRCNPRNYMDFFGLFQIPGAFHLTIGESF